MLFIKNFMQSMKTKMCQCQSTQEQRLGSVVRKQMLRKASGAWAENKLCDPEVLPDANKDLTTSWAAFGSIQQ